MGRLILRFLVLASLAPSAALAQPTFDEVVYATVPVNGGTFALTLDIYSATSGSGPRPALLWIHGGGWSGGSHNVAPPPFVLGLRSQGITVVSVEYRLSGQAIFPAQVQDVKGAVRWLRANAATYNLDPARFGSWGTSAGGHLSALLATSGGVAELEGTTGGNAGLSSSIQAAVDYFGPTDIINISLDVTTPPGSAFNHDDPASPESALIGFSGVGQGIGVLRANLANPNAPYPDKVHLANLVNPITHVDVSDPPMYIGHGDQDTTVPTFQSVRLHNALSAGGVTSTLRIAPGSGHGSLGTDTNTAAAAFMAAALTGSATCVPPTVIEPPRGIYCSCAPTSANSHSVVPGIAAKDFVEGTLLRISWRDLQTGPTTIDWTMLDNQLIRARTYNTKVALGIVNGPLSPTWLAGQGAQMFNFITPQGSSASMPVPWDPVYLAAWTDFVAQLGARYNADTTITLVHVTHSSSNGFEMQLPFWSTYTSQWNSIGYTAQRTIDSWTTVIDAFAAAFPSKPLDVEVHPVLASDQVAQGVWDHAQSNYGERFGLFAAWWSQNNAANVYPGMHTLLRQAAESSFGTIQLVTNATSNPNGFGTGGIAGAFDLAAQGGIRYAEVWNQDLLNTSLEPLLRQTAQRFLVPAPVCTGSTATFSTQAVGTGPLTFRWSRSNLPLTDDGRIQGSNTRTLTIANVAAADSGNYTCVVTNACGSATNTSTTLTICPADRTCDASVDIDDLLDFLVGFESGSAAADLDNGSNTGTPDNAVDINDLLFFLARFEAGC